MSIRMSPKHGVNPSVAVCFYCNEDTGELILPGMLRGDKEAPARAVWDRVPCDKCKQHMRDGVILISVRDGESGDNPYRTGGWCVVTDAYIRRVVTETDLAEDICSKRVAFIPDEAWDLMGLPRGEKVEGAR